MSGPDVLQQVARMLVGGVPHNEALGLSVRHFGQGRAETTLPWAERLVGDPRTGVLHGGAITSTIDATCGAAVFAGLRAPTPIATLDLRVDYLRPARSGENVLCDATCDKVTRHVAFTRATAHHGDPRDPIATAAATFMVFRRGRPGSAKISSRPAMESEPAAPEDPSPPLEASFDDALASARQGGDVDPLVRAIPYATFLGLRARVGEGAHGGRRTMVLPFRATNIGDASLPALHGGTLGALLEAAALFELFAAHPPPSSKDALPRTINATFDFQRSGRPVTTHAVAEVIRAGRRVATVHARAWQDDFAAPVATAQMHALLAE